MANPQPPPDEDGDEEALGLIVSLAAAILVDATLAYQHHSGHSIDVARNQVSHELDYWRGQLKA